MTHEDMLPKAEKMPTIASVAEARRRLAADHELAAEMLAEASEQRLQTKCPAHPGPRPMPLGQHLLGMIHHLGAHKSQLFYYLKLQGKPVNTHILWVV